MTVPSNSLGPQAPSTGSPLRPISSFTEWFGYIATWIRGLSPSGATSYDSGWVDVTVNGGFAAQGTLEPQVRRLGRVVFMRWGWSNTGISAEGAFTVGTIPAGFRPGQEVHAFVASHTSVDTYHASGVITSTGDVILKSSSKVGNYYLFDSFSWTV